MAGLIARTQLTLSEIDARIPAAAVVRRSVPTPWAAKGAVMREVVEHAGTARTDTTDGVKMISPDGRWVLVIPDPAEAMTHLWAEGTDTADSARLLRSGAASSRGHRLDRRCRLEDLDGKPVARRLAADQPSAVGSSWSSVVDDVVGDLLDRLHPVDLDQHPAIAVVVDDRSRLLLIGLQPLADHVFGVVLAALLVGAVQQPADQLRLVGREIDGRLGRQAQRLRRLMPSMAWWTVRGKPSRM